MMPGTKKTILVQADELQCHDAQSFIAARVATVLVPRTQAEFMFQNFKMDGADFIAVMQCTVTRHLMELPMSFLDSCNEAELTAMMQQVFAERCSHRRCHRS